EPEMPRPGPAPTAIRASRVDAVLFEQRADVRAAAPEFDECLESVATAAPGQDGIQKALRGSRLEHPSLLEGGECIRRQDFGPLVTIITSGITAGEDMSEAVWKTVPLGDRDYRHLAAHFVQDLHDASAALRRVFGVQTEIEQRELELSHGLQPRVETTGSDEPRLHGLRQRRTALEMPGNLPQDLWMPRVVLEKLTRQLHRIPRDAVDARDAGIVDTSQHVVQAMAELVEHRQHVVVGQERRTTVARGQ